jgi:uncharacterized protein (DUF1778 family)
MAYKMLAARENELSIRASGAERDMLARAARMRRLDTSQFVLRASLDAVQAVLSERELRHARMRRPQRQWATQVSFRTCAA